ncbi:MAG: glycosyltransferase family 4 protein [Bacteroidetes bacterium]|nr:glycosyltransferase family 4 protein [Bacteroidota bacterium]
MIKVLWFTNTASLAAARLNRAVVGGGWIESLERRLQDRDDIRLAVAFAHGKKPQPEKFVEGRTTYYAVGDVRSRARVFLGRHLAMNDDELFLWSCIDVIRDFQPDVINIFGTEKCYGLLSNRTAVPVVIHLQGLLSMYEQNYMPRGVGATTLLRHSGAKSLAKATSLLHQYWSFLAAGRREKKIFAVNRNFIGRTDWDRRATELLSPGARYFYGSEILRREFYSATWDKHPAETKTFISTIQPNPYKGLETVLECAALLKQRPGFSFRWKVAGFPPGHDLVRLFEKKVGVRAADVGVELLGGLGPQQLLAAELDADVFVHPSHIDNSPNSVCEAMLLGMPVVATDTGGTGSLLVSGKEGILIQDGAPSSMAAALIDLTGDYGYAAELGRNARRRALGRHDPDAITDNLIDIYTQVIKKKEAWHSKPAVSLK